MQSAEEEEGLKESATQNEGYTNLQDEGGEVAEGSGAPGSLGPEEPSAPQPGDLSPQPDFDLSVAVPHLLSPDSAEDMEDEESPQEQEEEEEDFIIIDPEHPLVRRFQGALSNLFRKQLERGKSELYEKIGFEREDDDRNQEVLVDMFRVQEHLATVQKRLEDIHQTKADAEAKRQQAHDQLEVVKSRYSNISSQNSQAQAEVTKLHALLDRFLQHLLITQGHIEDLHFKVKTVNNFRHKAAAEKTQAEERKLKQDLYVERLTKEMERLTQQIAMYEAQASAQAEETRAAKEALSEAEMKMELHLMGHKQLVQQWNRSLMARRRRVEASDSMQDVRFVEHQVNLLDREIESYKKSFIAEQEKNETLTQQLSWSEMDCATSEKLISQKRAQQEALQADYSTCLRIVHETERTLTALTKETGTYQTELNIQRRQLEKESCVRLELEDKIMTYMQKKLTHNKAAKYSQQLTAKTAALKNKKMHHLQQLENEVLSVKLEKQKVEQHVSQLALTQQTLDEEVAKLNKLLNLSQAKFSSFVQLIEQKQATVSICNSKISQIVASTGNEDLSPQHIKVQQIMAHIEELAAQINNNHQLWMTQQGTLVGLNQEIEADSREMRKLQMDYTGMQQRKIRLESQIELEEREEAELESNSRMLRRDLVKLNTLLSKNQELSQALDEENTLMETDFLHRIKEAEWKSVNMQMKLSETQEEKERLLNCLVEAERQIMLWEKKTQILKETRSVVDSELHEGEIKKMKAEIHRMELRVSLLTKQQEQLMRESEAVVAKRETLILRKEAMGHSSHRQKTTGELQRSNEGLQRKIKLTRKEVSECEHVFRELQQSQLSLGDSLVQEKQQLTELFCTSNVLGSDMTNLQDAKERKLARLITLQNRKKRLQGVSEGSYKASSTSETLGAALQCHTERLQAISTILHQTCEEFAQHQAALSRVSRALAARAKTPEKETP
ncbi:coiled-coil domain-containing protein 40 [Odontesthes bonariensis]|uniref:coiled-coil domain-containing protein 40 n=1 Tax=Odontesthes bonariensis TaxID=219752 RepID=UPI003F58A24D